MTSPREASNVWSGIPTFRPRTVICRDSVQLIPTSLLAPHITTLIFAHDRGVWDEKWLSDFSRDICNVASSLQVLEISLIPRPISMNIIRRLGDLHVLRRLKLSFTDDCAHSWLQQSPLSISSPHSGLAALEELDIEAPIPIVQSILSFAGINLRKLRITGAPFDSAELVSGVFKQISEGPWATQMTHLRYDISNRWPMVGDWEESLNEWGIPYFTPETVLITSSHLQPLLRLTALSHLALTFHTTPRINDTFLHALARDLSQLQNLSIGGRDHNDETYPLTTLRGALVLANLPLLSALQLPLDLRPQSTPSVNQPFESLTRLSVLGCPAPSDSAFVSTFASAFPKLRKVYVRSPAYDEAPSDGWSTVWEAWQGHQDTKNLEIEPVFALDELDEQLPDDDFFAAAVRDAVGIDEAENESVDYLTCEVDLDEYYARFPDARIQRDPIAIDDVIYTSLQSLSV